MRTIDLVALATVAAASLPAFGQDPPSTVDLSVVIRDFSKNHTDFNVLPATGYGYYAGNVALDLDADGKPVYTGQGFRAASLWRDASGNIIAPHLFNTCDFAAARPLVDPGRTSFRITVAESVRITKRSVLDSFDSNLGAYGDQDAGEAVLIMANGSHRKHRYVRVGRHSTVLGDVLVHPDDDPAEAVRISRTGRVSGELARMDSEAEIADLETPVPDLGASVGTIKHTGGEHTISEDLHCKSLKLKKRATLTVRGDVTIWCDRDLELDDGSVLNIEGNVVIRTDGEFELDDGSEVILADEATLTLYVGEELELGDRSMLNMNTGNPQLVSVIMMDLGRRGTSTVELDDRSMAAAWVHGPGTAFRVDDGAEFFGSFMGRTLRVSDGSRFHVDMATATQATGGVVFEPHPCDLGDSPGSVALASGGDVASARSFSEWWRDVLGVNQSTVQIIRLIRNKFGVYFYLHNNYRPINGLLLGNEGDFNNYHFTAEIDAVFTYATGTGQWLEVRCTDDAYVFINGRLVLDLGGYGYDKMMYVDVDRLGLTDGETARMQLFHAQRQHGLGIFRLQTNIALSDTMTSPSVTGILED